MDNEKERQPDSQPPVSCNPANPDGQQPPYGSREQQPAYRNPAAPYLQAASQQETYNPSLYTAPPDTEKEPRILLRSAGNSASFVPILEQLVAAPILFVALLIWIIANLNQLLPSIRRIGVEAVTKYFQTSEGATVLLMLSIVTTLFAMIATVFITRSFLHRRIKEQWKRPSLSFPEYVKYLVVAFGISAIGTWWSTAIDALCKNAGIDVTMPNFSLTDNPAETAIMLTYVCFVGPILEETLFRGLILQSLRPWGDKLAIVVSGVLFGLMHMNLFQGLTAALLGMLFGFVAIKSGSIIPTVILHILYNSTLMAFELRGLEDNPALQTAYQIFLGITLLAGLVLISMRRIPFHEVSKQAAPNIVQPEHPYRVVFLQSAAFWVLAALFLVSSFYPAISGFFFHM